jgi:phage terminase small subunit
MGERGPTSRPTTLKLLRGEKHRDRLNLNPPKPRAKLPTMPSEMSSGAKVVWRRILRDFGHTGVLTSIDADILRAYCDAVARYNHAARLLDESGIPSRSTPSTSSAGRIVAGVARPQGLRAPSPADLATGTLAG